MNAEGAMKPETVPRSRKSPPPSRNLPPAKPPVYLVLLWPGQTGEWEGRIKDAKTGAEQPFHELEELLSWLSHKQERRRT
jgi:hypothetical protein